MVTRSTFGHTVDFDGAIFKVGRDFSWKYDKERSPLVVRYTAVTFPTWDVTKSARYVPEPVTQEPLAAGQQRAKNLAELPYPNLQTVERSRR